MPSTSSGDSLSACTIIWAATKPSLVNRSTSWPFSSRCVARAWYASVSEAPSKKCDRKLISAEEAPKADQLGLMSRPVTTVDDANTPCCSSEPHIWAALAPAQATNSRSGAASAACRANGVRSVAGRVHQQRRHGGALRAEHGGHGRGVRLAEGVVLREDRDGLALHVLEEGGRGEDVLVGLPPGAEGVVVDAGEAVGGGRAGDEQDVVLRGQRCHLEAHAGGGRAGDHLRALADQVGGGGHRLGGVTGVVGLGDLDGAPVDLTGPVRGVVEPRLEPGEVLRAVGGQRPRLGVHQPDLDRGAAGLLGTLVGRRRAGSTWGAAGGEDGHQADGQDRHDPAQRGAAQGGTAQGGTGAGGPDVLAGHGVSSSRAVCVTLAGFDRFGR